VLQNLNEAVRECLQCASECRRVAESASDARIRSDFLDMERRWLKLAESYQFAERISCWIATVRRGKPGGR
jgi:hypothetical protein